MRRGFWLLAAALLLAACIFVGFFYSMTARTREMRLLQPDMAWLVMEYHLSPAQADKIGKINAAYRPICDKMCARIASQQAILGNLIGENRSITPVLEAALQRSSTLQAECRLSMLGHIYDVGHEMDPAQAARYLAAMQGSILQPGVLHFSSPTPARNE